MEDAPKRKPELLNALVLWNWTEATSELPNISPNDSHFDQLEAAFALAGLRTNLINIRDNLDRIDQAIAVYRPALICNLVDHFCGDATMHSQVASYLETKNIPFTGPDATCMMNCQDRSISRSILKDAGISVPAFATIREIDRLPKTDNLSPPLTISQAYEDTYFSEESNLENSDGVLVQTLANALYEEFQLPFLVEEKLSQNRVGVVVVQKQDVEVLEPCNMDDLYNASRMNLGDDVVTRLKDAAKRAFSLLGCKDVALVEFACRDDQKFACVNVRPVFPLFADDGPFAAGLPESKTLYQELAQIAAVAVSNDAK